MRLSNRAIVAASLALGSVGVFATPALAGEITGNGRSLKQPDGTLHGKSECAFSGLNDGFTGDPNVPDEDGFFRTQSWGQIPKEFRDVLTADGISPRALCNPTTGAHE